MKTLEDKNKIKQRNNTMKKSDENYSVENANQ